MATVQTEKRGFLTRITAASLDFVERVGNKLPDPVTLFVILMALVVVISWIMAKLGVSVIHPDPNRAEEIRAVSLLTKENIQRFLQEMPTTFTNFPPLGLVLVVMLGIGVAERTGLIAIGLKAFVGSVPRSLVTAAVVFAGLMSSLAVDAGYVVLVPLGAVIFHGMGRHPLAGLAAAFAGVSGGFSSNLLLTSLDPLLGGFSTSAANIIDPNYVVEPTANWYLMATLVPAFTIAGTVITNRVIEPRLGPYRGEVDGAEENRPLTPTERRGLIFAAIGMFAALGVIALMAIPENGLLRGENGEITPFLSSIVALMFFLFLIPGLIYGIVTGSIKSDKDAATMTAETMASMGAYIVLAFVAAHFIAFFNWSNLGIILAVTGANALKAIEFEGLPLIVSFVVLSSFINLFIGSASAKWAIMAPVFVPMLMLMGYSPEMTQAAYRIGDSFTNIITPLLPYFPLVIIFAQKYQKDVGIGTLISVMLPYSIAFGIVGILLLVAWIVFGIPLGPGAPMYYTP